MTLVADIAINDQAKETQAYFSQGQDFARLTYYGSKSSNLALDYKLPIFTSSISSLGFSKERKKFFNSLSRATVLSRLHDPLF